MNRITLLVFLSILLLSAIALPPMASASPQRDPGTPAKGKVAQPEWKRGALARDKAGRLIVDPTSRRLDAHDPERFAFLKDYPTSVGLSCNGRKASGHLDTKAPAHVKSIVHELAPKYDLDPRLVLAVIAVESNFQASAVSPKNAQGLMQLIPDTAKRFGVRDPFNPSENIRGGMLYLRWLLKTFNGDVALALAGYNAGEKAVEKHKGVPPYNETRQYIQKIHQLYGCASGAIAARVAPSGPGAGKSAWPQAREPYDLWNAAQNSVERGPDSRCRLRLGRDPDHRLSAGFATGGTAFCR